MIIRIENKNKTEINKILIDNNCPPIIINSITERMEDLIRNDKKQPVVFFEKYSFILECKETDNGFALNDLSIL